ncbi:MAG: hypothetical protein RL226_1412 [Bacteroidota bacterium]|jgi:hypothetical protein
MKDAIDKFWFGIVFGILNSFLGFFLFAYIWSLVYNEHIKTFIYDAFLNTDLFKDKIITVSVIFNVFVFYFFMRWEYYRLCKGLLTVIILAIPFIVYYY